jgi:hypothetical protein
LFSEEQGGWRSAYDLGVGAAALLAGGMVGVELVYPNLLSHLRDEWPSTPSVHVIIITGTEFITASDLQNISQHISDSS